MVANFNKRGLILKPDFVAAFKFISKRSFPSLFIKLTSTPRFALPGVSEIVRVLLFFAWLNKNLSLSLLVI